jgi:hypothetical protein
MKIVGVFFYAYLCFAVFAGDVVYGCGGVGFAEGVEVNLDHFICSPLVSTWSAMQITQDSGRLHGFPCRIGQKLGSKLDSHPINVASLVCVVFGLLSSFGNLAS